MTHLSRPTLFSTTAIIFGGIASLGSLTGKTIDAGGGALMGAVEFASSKCAHMASVRQKKLQVAAQSLHETQTNVLAVYERNREIEELPPGLETGYTNRRKRGARTDEDCINEVCELISRGITASAATEFVGLPWSTWHAWIRRNHCQAKEKHHDGKRLWY